MRVISTKVRQGSKNEICYPLAYRFNSKGSNQGQVCAWNNRARKNGLSSDSRYYLLYTKSCDFVRNNASWLFRKWQKRVAFCFCPGSVAVAIFTMCLEAPYHFATKNQKIPQWTIIPNKNLGEVQFNLFLAIFWEPRKRWYQITPSYFPVTNRSWPQTSLSKTGNLEAWGLTVLSSFCLKHSDTKALLYDVPRPFSATQHQES